MWCSGKESSCRCRRCRRPGFDPWVGKIPWSRKWQPTPVFLPGKSHGQEPGGLQSVGLQRVRRDRATEHVYSTTSCVYTSIPVLRGLQNNIGYYSFPLGISSLAVSGRHAPPPQIFLVVMQRILWSSINYYCCCCC